jgi:hypothetical protein
MQLVRCAWGWQEGYSLLHGKRQDINLPRSVQGGHFASVHERRLLQAGNYSFYSVALGVGCNASAVQRVADDLQGVYSTPNFTVSPVAFLLCTGIRD